MTTRPTVSPLFATDATFSAGSESGLVPRLDPGAGFRGQGVYPNTRVAARHWNFLRGIVGDWAAYLAQKTDHCQNVLNFGANPLGSSDSAAAIQAADAAAATSGGFVLFPAGSYRHDASLHPTPGVSWIGVPDLTFLNINHATQPQLVFDTSASNQRFTEFSGLGFGALVDNTGDAVSISHRVNLRFSNCAWNDPGFGSPRLKGRLLLGQGTGTQVIYDTCYLDALGTATALFWSSSSGRLRVQGCELLMPVTYTGPLVEIDDGQLQALHNLFDVTAHTGSADVIELIATGYHLLKGNKFLGATSSGASVKTLSGGIKLSASGNLFDTINTYSLAAALATGSQVDLVPQLQQLATSGFITLPAWIASHTVISSFTTSPTVTFQAPLFEGQPLDFTLRNSHASIDWAGLINLAGPVYYSASDYGGLVHGHTLTASFVAQRLSSGGQLTWVQQGAAMNA